MTKGKLAAVLIVCLAMMSVSTANATTKAVVPKITKEHIKGMLGNLNLNVIVLDVRFSGEWQRSEIKGAIREIPSKFESWANKYPRDKIIVLY